MCVRELFTVVALIRIYMIDVIISIIVRYERNEKKGVDAF